jgi:DNA repair exonuclease SbcCD ATPase subunit
MITLKALNMSGMFSCGLVQTIPLENIGCVFVRGINEDHNDRSCGSGKSSILNAIKEILFERNDTGKSGPNVPNKHKEWARGMFGVLWLMDRSNKLWRIMLLRKWKGHPPDPSILSEPSEIITNGEKYTGSDLFLESWDGQKWKDERPTSTTTKTTQTAKDKIRNEILGMTYDQFSAYVCLGQQAESSLVMGTGGEREKIIQAVVDVSVWDAAANVVKNLITSRETQCSQVGSKISGMDAAMATITMPTPAMMGAAQCLCETISQDMGVLNNDLMMALAAEKVVENELKASEGEIEGLKQELDILIAEERHSNERFHGYISKAPREMDELSISIESLQRIIDQNNVAAARYRSMMGAVGQLMAVGKCSLCGQPITEKHLVEEIKHIEDATSPIVMEMKEKIHKHQQMKVEYEAAAEEQRKLVKATYDHEIAGIHDARSKLIARMQKPLEVKTKLEISRGASMSAQAKLRGREQDYRHATSDLKGLEMRVVECGKLITTRTNAQSELASLTDEMQHLRWVERNLKKIKLTEYEAAIERLNILIAEELHKLWGPGLGARFVTAQDKARGGVKQELELMVYSPKKDEVSIELHSGGEKKTVIIAVFKAMSRLAAERGLSVNLVAIDEIDKDLDDIGTDGLVESFESIASNSSSCIIISHNTRLLNTMCFDDIWTVRKSNEFSTIEIGSKAQEKVA